MDLRILHSSSRTRFPSSALLLDGMGV